MQMGKPGTNAWKNALRYAIRILYLRTTSGVLTLTDLLGLPVTQRNVSMHVYLVAALSSKFLWYYIAVRMKSSGVSKTRIFEVEPEKADKIQPNRPAKPAPVVSKPSPRPPITESIAKNEDLPSTSA
ncbi:uncharacterized protein E5676_scaffold255G007410 [Cucumis melo var. makuwa]|uniref:Uncharacterized protein n=1 Tax=Cucumis melo var. makuwa TaxID=1194695 RepID=A0A5D3CMU3_CUCMM|nr:uncharacterized protein E5676_scaffold255G007410 [Cucumis melo var. makuwa]